MCVAADSLAASKTRIAFARRCAATFGNRWAPHFLVGPFRVDWTWFCFAYDGRSVGRFSLLRRRALLGNMVASRLCFFKAPSDMSFDLLAPHYRWMEFLLAGEKLQRCRTTFLNQIPNAKQILLLGEGHGRCLVECCLRFPNARITYLDSSRRMLDQARRHLARHDFGTDRIQFIHSDVFDWIPPEKTYDLVIANFFLDCFCSDQLERIAERIASTATLGGHWLIADFQTAQSGFRHFRSQMILRAMYFFFRVFTGLHAKKLTAPDAYLQSAGFVLHRRTESEWGLLHADWWKRA